MHTRHLQRLVDGQVEAGVEIKDPDVVSLRTKNDAAKSGVGDGETRLPVQVGCAAAAAAAGVRFRVDLTKVSRGEATRRRIPEAQPPVAAVREKMTTVGSKVDAFDGATMREGGGSGGTGEKNG